MNSITKKTFTLYPTEYKMKDFIALLKNEKKMGHKMTFKMLIC